MYQYSSSVNITKNDWNVILNRCTTRGKGVLRGGKIERAEKIHAVSGHFSLPLKSQINDAGADRFLDSFPLY
jgi:hypothetical protein